MKTNVEYIAKHKGSELKFHVKLRPDNTIECCGQVVGTKSDFDAHYDIVNPTMDSYVEDMKARHPLYQEPPRMLRGKA